MKGVDCAHVSTIFRLDFVTIPTVVFFVFLLDFVTIPTVVFFVFLLDFVTIPTVVFFVFLLDFVTIPTVVFFVCHCIAPWCECRFVLMTISLYLFLFFLYHAITEYRLKITF